MAELPALRTMFTAAELAAALTEGWRTLFGAAPSRNAILVLMAQSAHETGQWGKVICFNIGNVKSVEGDGYDHTFFRTREKENGRDLVYEPPHPATRFRAFRSLADGVIDHLAFLYGKRRYAAAWEALKTGDPTKFAKALKEGGYYTDPVEVYARGLERYFAKFDSSVPLELEPLVIDEETARRTQGLVADSLRKMAGEFVTGETDPAPPPADEPNA